jgi:hypothetical protein
MVRPAIPSPCYRHDVMLTDEFWSEVIPDVCRISEARQENERPSRPSKIEDF